MTTTTETKTDTQAAEKIPGIFASFKIMIVEGCAFGAEIARTGRLSAKTTSNLASIMEAKSDAYRKAEAIKDHAMVTALNEKYANLTTE